MRNDNPEGAVVYYFYSTPATIDLHKEAVRRFTERYPDIGVKIVPCAWGQYLTKIKTAVAARRDIDVIYSSDAWTASFASSGLLLDLQPFVDRDLNEDDYLPNILLNGRYPARPDGNIHAIANFWVTNLLFYNRDMFESEGVDHPTEDWDWDDLLGAAKALTKDLNGDGKLDVYGLGPFECMNFCDYVWSNGGEVLSEDYKTCLLDRPQSVGALRWVSDLVMKHRVVPQPQDMSFSTMTYPFSEEKVAMVHQGSYNTLVYKDFNADWDVAPVPQRDGTRFNYSGTNPFSIVKYSRRPEKAWTFVRFMISEEISLLFNQMGGAPVLADLVDDPRYWEIENIPDHYREAMAISAKTARGLEWGAPHWSEWTKSWNSELSEVLAGRRTVEQGTERMKEAIERVVRRR